LNNQQIGMNAVDPRALGAYLGDSMRPDVHREIARLMAQLRRLVSIAINKQLAVVGSSLHEYVVLSRLFEEADEQAPQSELAYDAAIDPAAVSRLVRDMTEAGLVTTRVDETDKRQRFVRLTAKGRTLVRTLSPIVNTTLEPYMAGLSDEEEQEFLRLLRKAYATVAKVAVEREKQSAVSEPARAKSKAAKR
jgi:MarR family transcriptional regulator, lower aerobic nicotinate degradation pathway regulator